MRSVVRFGCIVLLALVCASGIAFAGNGKGKMKGKGGGDRLRDGSCQSHFIGADAELILAGDGNGPGDGTGNGGVGPADGTGNGAPDGAGTCG